MAIGLRTKLLVPTISVVILCMGFASLYSAKKASEALWSELINSSQHLTQGVVKGLEMFVEGARGAVIMQSKNDKIRQVFLEKTPETLKAASEALVELTKFDPSIHGANLLDTKGEVIASSDPSGKGNFSDREYFKKAIKGETNIADPVISRVTNQPAVMVATPVTAGGKIVGILYVRVDLAKFSDDLVIPVKVGQNGYAYVADRKGIIFSHPDSKLVLKMNISDYDWGKTMLSSPSGVVHYELDGRSVSAIYAKEKNTGWLVVVTVNSSDIAAASDSVRNASLLIGAIGIVLVCAALVLVLGQMLKALGQCVSFAETVAGGCLDCSLGVERTDELGRLSHALQVMVDSLRKMIATAEGNTAEAKNQTELARQATAEAEKAMTRAEQAKAEGMLQAAQRLEGVVISVSAASEELSSQIEESSRGAESQSQRTAETATAMEEMNATVLEVSKNASSAAEITDHAMKKAQEGAGVVGRVVTCIGEVKRQADNLKTDMSKLGQQAQDIGQIMNVISDIADQTNLLALNAAIEAARAGEAGRGFAVVADEVRKLAEKTMQATKEVGEAIQGIQQGTKINVQNVEQAAGSIHDATELARLSGVTLDEIVRMVEHASDQVRSIATAAEEQSAASEEINRSIDDINSISATTTSAMIEAARAVSGLTDQAHTLKTLMEELENDGAAAGSPKALA